MPLSFLWIEDTLLLSTARTTPTARNLRTNPTAHLAIGDTRDVILISGTAERLNTVPNALATAFAEKAGFDPHPANYPYFRITPTRIQAWREVNEIKARDLMTNSTWLV